MPKTKTITIVASVAGLAVVVTVGYAFFVTNQQKPNDKVPIVVQSDAPEAFAEEYAKDLQVARRNVAEHGDSSKEQKIQNYTALGNAYLNNDQPKEAIDAFNQIFKIDSENNFFALHGLIYAYEADGQSAEALRIAEKLLSMQKQQAEGGAANSDISSLESIIARLKTGKGL